MQYHLSARPTIQHIASLLKKILPPKKVEWRSCNIVLDTLEAEFDIK